MTQFNGVYTSQDSILRDTSDMQFMPHESEEQLAVLAILTPPAAISQTAVDLKLVPRTFA